MQEDSDGTHEIMAKANELPICCGGACGARSANSGVEGKTVRCLSPFSHSYHNISQEMAQATFRRQLWGALLRQQRVTPIKLSMKDAEMLRTDTKVAANRP